MSSNGHTYKTLDGKLLYLTGLSKEEQRVLAEIQRAYARRPNWVRFTNSWREKVRSLYRELPPKERTSRPVYLIGEDLEARLGVSQNYFRAPDLRDELRELVDEKFQSRYAFCKATGLDEGSVSRLFRKKTTISVERLDEALHRIGLRLRLTRVEERKPKRGKTKATVG